MPFYISNRWRMRPAVWGLFIAEFAFTIPALALFAIAQPDLYRTRLRQVGYDHGYNSGPNQQVFAATNRQNIPTPLIWSQYITDYNVVISVLSMFLLLVKAIFFIMHWFKPWVGFLVHALLTGLWAYSTYAQVSPDTGDAARQQPGAPWYISKGCSVVSDSHVGLLGYCRQAQASLGVTAVMLFLFAANTVLALWSLIPTRAQRRARKGDYEDDSDSDFKFEPPPAGKGSKIWELQQYPKTAAKMEESTAQKSPFRFENPLTPRTVAYNKLGGAHPNNPGSAVQGSNSSSRDLPARFQ